MERSITEKEKDIIINSGAFNYEPLKIANILGWSAEEVTAFQKDIKSDFYKFYLQGKDKADYVIDLKLFELAQAGDLKAISVFEKRKRSNKG